MQRLTYSGPPTTVFPPICVAQTTTTGREAWRTDVRRPPFYGVYGVISIPLPPGGIGVSTLQRLNMMQPVNAIGTYIPVDKGGEKENG